MTPEMLKLQTDPIQRPLTMSIYIKYGIAIQWNILWLQRINIPCSVQKDLQLFLGYSSSGLCSSISNSTSSCFPTITTNHLFSIYNKIPPPCSFPEKIISSMLISNKDTIFETWVNEPMEKLLSAFLKKHAEEGKCDCILVKDTNRHEVAYYISKCIYKTTLNTKLLFPSYTEDLPWKFLYSFWIKI